MDFLRLYERYQAYLERIALAMLDNWDDASDALQEAALIGYRSFHKLQGGEAAFGRWMRRILIRTCLQIQQRRARDLPLDERTTGSLRADRSDPESSALELQRARQLWERVNRLDEHLRRVIQLRYLADLSQEEVAEALGIPVGTVKSRLSKGLSLLRTELNDEEREVGSGWSRMTDSKRS